MRYLSQTMHYLSQTMCYLTQAMSYLTQAMSYLSEAKSYLTQAKSYLSEAKSYLTQAKSYLTQAMSPYGTTNFPAEAKKSDVPPRFGRSLFWRFVLQIPQLKPWSTKKPIQFWISYLPPADHWLKHPPYPPVQHWIFIMPES